MLHDALRGVHNRAPTPVDLKLERGGLKSSILDSLPTETYELSVSCDRLPKRGKTIELDPMVVIFRKNDEAFDQDFIEVFRTERRGNDCNPRFENKFRISYLAGTRP